MMARKNLNITLKTLEVGNVFFWISQISRGSTALLVEQQQQQQQNVGIKISDVLALHRMMEQHQMQAHKERERRTSGSGEVLKQIHTPARVRSLSHTHTHSRRETWRPKFSQRLRNILAGLKRVKRGVGGICTALLKVYFFLLINMGRYQCWSGRAHFTLHQHTGDVTLINTRNSSQLTR